MTDSTAGEPGHDPAPAVSVVITSLNRPDYLREACASVLAGTFADIEVFICDDASDRAGARDAARQIADADPRVTVIQNESRLGQFRSICQAFRRMSGAYFAVLNDDDTWEPEFLARLVAPLERDGELVASFCDHFVIASDGQVDGGRTEAVSARCHRTGLSNGRHEDSAHLALGLSAFPTVVASVFRTTAVDWDRFFDAATDVSGFPDLWLQACVLGDAAPVWYEPRRLSSYRLHGGQLISQRNLRLTQAKMWILNEILADPAFRGSRKAAKRQLMTAAYGLGMGYLRRGEIDAARLYLRWAAFDGPRLRAVAALALSLRAWPMTTLLERLSGTSR